MNFGSDPAARAVCAAPERADIIFAEVDTPMKLRWHGHPFAYLLPLTVVGALHCSSDRSGSSSEQRMPSARTFQSDVKLQEADIPKGPVEQVYIAPLDNTPPPNASAPHPRLAFSAADLPALRARVNEAGSMRQFAFQALKKKVDDYVIPVATNSVDAQGKFGREDVAQTALVWLLTQDDTYLQKAKAILDVQMKTGPAYGATLLFDAQDYYTQRSWVLNGFALAYDWMYSVLSDDQRTQLRNAIIGLGTELFVDANTAWWATITTASNFTGNNGTAFGTAGLAIWEEAPDTAPAWVARATQLLRSYGGGGFDATGASYEGVLYGNYGLRNPTYFAYALERAGGPNPLREPNLSHHEEWFAYELLPGGGALNPMDDARYTELEEMYLTWASSHGSSPALAQWIQKQWRKPDGVPLTQSATGLGEVLFYEEPPAGFVPEQQLPLAKFFSGLGLVHVKSDFTDPNGFAAAFEARQTNFGQGVHQQADIGNFVLYAQGARFAIDSGYCNYVEGLLGGNTNAVRSCQTEGHNAVQADGRSQDFLGHGQVRTFDSTAAVGDAGALDVAVSDARQAYVLLQPARADRMFLHVRGDGAYPEYLVVSDAFRQDGLLSHNYTSFLHTDKANKVVTSGAGVSVSTQITAPNGAVLNGTWVAPGGLSVAVDSFTADYDGVGTHPRVVVSSNSVELDAVEVLTPVAAGQTAPAVQAVVATGGVAAGVVLDGTTHDLVLEATGSSAVRAQGANAAGNFAWLRLGASGLPTRYGLVEGTHLDVNGAALADVSGAAGTVLVAPGVVSVSGNGVTGFRVYAGPKAPSRVTLNGSAVDASVCGSTVVYPASANCP